MMVQMLPEMADSRITHCWNGNIGVTFDQLPYVGIHRGMHFVAGQCSTGVPMSTWLGHKVASRILEHADSDTPFDNREPKSRFYYRSNPWFVAPYAK